MLRRSGELFAAADSPLASPDPADTKFLRCADAAQTEFIVTGNRRDFPQASYGPTRLVSAGELPARIAGDI